MTDDEKGKLQRRMQAHLTDALQSIESAQDLADQLNCGFEFLGAKWFDDSWTLWDNQRFTSTPPGEERPKPKLLAEWSQSSFCIEYDT